ncbi:MAG: hypothetical protein AAF755_10240 [Pseudomonadota bacterium]
MNANREKALVLAKQGVRPKDIAYILECAPKTIHEWLRTARQSGHNIQKFKGAHDTRMSKENDPANGSLVRLPVRLAASMQARADAHDKTLGEYVTELCERDILKSEYFE